MKILQYFLALIITVSLFSACGNDSETIDNTNTTDSTTVQNTEQDYIERLDAATVIINEDTTNAQSYFDRGLLLIELGLGDKALGDILKASIMDRENDTYCATLSQLFFDLAQSERALQAIGKCISDNPSNMDLRITMAKYHLILTQYEKSLQILNGILVKDVFNSEAYYWKAINYKYLEDENKMLSSLQTAVEQNSDYYEAYIELGFTYAERKEMNKSVLYFDNAIRIQPQNTEAYYAKAFTLQEAEKYEEAKVAYKDLLLADMQNIDATFNTGYIYYLQDSLDLAWKQFNIVTKQDPTQTRAYYWRGFMKEELGETETAIADYEQALIFDENNKDALEGLERLKK